MTKVYISIEAGLPPAGDYECKIIRNGRDMVQSKRLVINEKTGAHAWFGGCRPFCEKDVVTHYAIDNPDV